MAAALVLVLISWVLFRSANLHEAMDYLGAMIGQGRSGSGTLLLSALLYTQAKEDSEVTDAIRRERAADLPPSG